MGKVVKIPSKPTAYGTGLIALDIVISSNPEVPTRQWAGGTCGNVLTILSYLGWNAYPIARLNNEPSSVHAKHDLQRWKVCQDFVEMEPVASIPVITQENTTDGNGQPRHRFHWKNCPKCGSWLPNYKPVTLKAVETLKESVSTADIFFFDRTSPGALEMARHFKSIGSAIFFEPSAKGDPKHFREAIALSDIIKYSDQRFSDVITRDIEEHRPALEIQTLGGNGLRFRSRRQKNWAHLPAHKAIDMVDSSGCGDWTTAGIINNLFSKDSHALGKLKKDEIQDAMHYGQALGAWNCGFEGARGGMYQMTFKAFEEDIRAILKGGAYRPRNKSKQDYLESASDGLCPACPTV